jgi:DNA-binding NarL/FixJ family response regulator
MFEDTMRTHTTNDPLRIILADDHLAVRASATRTQHRVAPLDERTQFAALSEREREVLILVAEGYSATEIGERLLISPKTVETHKQQVWEKLAQQC